MLGLLLRFPTLLLLVLAFALLSLQNLAEDGLSHYLINFLFKVEGLVGRDGSADFAFGSGCLDDQAELLCSILAVFETI